MTRRWTQVANNPAFGGKSNDDTWSKASEAAASARNALAKCRTLEALVPGCDPDVASVTSGFMEVTPPGSLTPTAITWWTSSARTQKLWEREITYSGLNPVTVITRFYSEGILSRTYTDSITYVGAAQSTLTRTETLP